MSTPSPNTWIVKYTGTVSVQWNYSTSDGSIGTLAGSFDPNGSESPETAAARIVAAKNEWWAKEQRRRRDEEEATAAFNAKITVLVARIRNKLINLGQTVQE